jgi:hypothetical protein
MEQLRNFAPYILVPLTMLFLALVLYFLMVDLVYPDDPYPDPPPPELENYFTNGYNALLEAGGIINQNLKGTQDDPCLPKSANEQAQEKVKTALENFKGVLRMNPTHEEGQHNFQLARGISVSLKQLRECDEDDEQQNDQQNQCDQNQSQSQQKKQPQPVQAQPADKDEFDSYLQELKDQEAKEREKMMAEMQEADNEQDW